ncbi:unnamed protein product [Rotaria magnacalcarata]|uniref:F-box domain-containing protein n=1 Tax=Rotaria magnacalcarata TaxID=392030 RepID=A0A8S2LYH8_9BILA|nr:unnamed protein product [Rotaria magnacalcarata]
MSLERLANELLFDVFEYLSCVDLFHAFNELNCRFNSLLIEYFRHQTYFDFRLIFKEDLSMIRRRYLPLFINEIKSICLSDDDQTPHEIDIFISRLYPLHRFQNLQSISLLNIYSIEKINRILDDLQQIPYLINLNLKQYNHYLTYNYVENLNYCCTTLEGINFSKIQFCNLQHLTLTFPYDDNFRCIVPQFKNLTYLEIIMVNLSQYDNDLQQLQIIFDQAPNLYRLKFHSWLSIPSKFENKNKKTSNQTVWTMPPFSSRSSSVRYLDLRGINQSGQSHYYNDQHCLSLIRSPLGSQCEFLRIEVEKRTNIIDLVNRMNHLRTLNVLCRDRKRNDDLVKWLQARLPSTCSFAKDSTSPNDIRLWIR